MIVKSKKSTGITALLQRLNWKLAQDGKLLRRISTPACRRILGDYCVTSLATGAVSTHVDLIELAQRLGVALPPPREDPYPSVLIVEIQKRIEAAHEKALAADPKLFSRARQRSSASQRSASPGFTARAWRKSSRASGSRPWV